MVEVRALTGAAALDCLDDIARLRITVFRDWPYLYDGDLAYEVEYLSPFAKGDTSVLVGAFDGTKLIGAATGSGMEDHQTAFAAPLAAADLDASDVFYCAESVLLSNYRGQGIGHRFFDLREAHGRSLGRSWSVFCSVLRPDDHPMRPKSERSLAPFWRKRGYSPLPGVVADFDWRDIGEAKETAKPLQFWSRRL